MIPRRAALLSLALLGCASSHGMRRAPRYCPEPVAQAPAGRSPAQELERQGPVVRTQSVGVTASSTGESSRDDEEESEPPCVPRPRPPQDAISGLEAQIAQGLAAFAAPEPECRDICRASDGVCAAAREICRLTGDAEAEHPLDLRCARAREACADAGRQRDGRCPTCPRS